MTRIWKYFLLLVLLLPAQENHIYANHIRPTTRQWFLELTEASQMSEKQIRIYQNGRVEYITYEDTISKKRNEIVRKQTLHKVTSIKRADIEKLISLAEQKDFLNANDRYRALVKSDDLPGLLIIKYAGKDKLKRVKVNNYQLSDKNAIGYYPQSLVMLINEIYKIVDKFKATH